MSRFDSMESKSSVDLLDEKIYECSLELDEMEERLREQIGEDFEDYLGLLRHYMDLLTYKMENKFFDNVEYLKR